jgi:hypothetical protein
MNDLDNFKNLACSPIIAVFGDVHGALDSMYA